MMLALDDHTQPYTLSMVKTRQFHNKTVMFWYLCVHFHHIDDYSNIRNSTASFGSTCVSWGINGAKLFLIILSAYLFCMFYRSEPHTDARGNLYTLFFSIPGISGRAAWCGTRLYRSAAWRWMTERVVGAPRRLVDSTIICASFVAKLPDFWAIESGKVIIFIFALLVPWNVWVCSEDMFCHCYYINKIINSNKWVWV